jgi:UDPglucose--hexose-1-phosphate uridylyltransferase
MFPHRRLNLLTGEWLLVSPQRLTRPWQGMEEAPAPARLPTHDPTCYLCPGNARAAGARNPQYTSTFVFTNDFPALSPDLPDHPAAAPHPLLAREPARGTCRVVCFSPRHDLTLAELPLPDIRHVIDLWAAETAELGRSYRWVQVFENKGELMGCSNPHPHGQIWALDALPSEPAKEDARQRAFLRDTGRVLLSEYVEVERQQRERLVVEHEHWVATVPYWAVWPFETLLVPRRPVRRLPELDGDERASLAGILKDLLTRYDGLFATSFPYSLGWHGAPFDGADHAHWQLHAHVYPPLLRSATVRKFLVGYELLAEAQRDLTPEQAAARLRGEPRPG